MMWACLFGGGVEVRVGGGKASHVRSDDVLATGRDRPRKGGKRVKGRTRRTAHPEEWAIDAGGAQTTWIWRSHPWISGVAVVEVVCGAE